MENRMPRFTEHTGANSGREEVTVVVTLATRVKLATCNLSWFQALSAIPANRAYPISDTTPNQCLFLSKSKKL